MCVIQAYQQKISSRQLQPEPAQLAVAQRLEALAQAIKRAQKGRLTRLFSRSEKPRGLYIHGDVGRGKTMLMDLFFESVVNWPKRRVHFHAFMQEVHRLRAQQKSIEQIADDIAAHAKLLCLDEMQIVDIADAMIIGRLFEALEVRGVVFVTTSNLPPDGLYKDGLNRQLFLPFIAKLNTSLDVISLDGAKDYRLGRVHAKDTYLYPATAENRVRFNDMWASLTDGGPTRDEVLEVLGRKLVVPKAGHGCASFTFQELCVAPLGPPDYLAIARAYRTVFLSGVPKLAASHRNEAKRFILMIDTFYDARTRLVVLADVPPEQICPKSQHRFEFARTVSRLKEMQAASWWEKPLAKA